MHRHALTDGVVVVVVVVVVLDGDGDVEVDATFDATTATTTLARTGGRFEVPPMYPVCTEERYERGAKLLEGVVAKLTKMI